MLAESDSIDHALAVRVFTVVVFGVHEKINQLKLVFGQNQSACDVQFHIGFDNSSSIDTFTHCLALPSVSLT